MKEKDTLKSQFSQENSNGTIRSVDRLRETGFVDTVQSSPPRKRFEGFTNVYRAISWIFGFKEKYSLAFCEYMVSEDFAPAYLSLSAVIFFGGALVGFCLARTMMMKPSNVRTMTVSGQYIFASLFGSKVPWLCYFPGEWFWYQQGMYKPSIFIHIYTSISEFGFKMRCWRMLYLIPPAS
jgi:hypothetical protein